jgi:endonuclease/exonuclease/phosphatase family metal-dependent hydrolase
MRDEAFAVMTRNMYVGAEVDAVIAALASPDPVDDQAALLAAIATLRETDFPARAAAIAREIDRTRPHVIGLQEVSKVDISLPPLGVDLHLDFLPALLAELAARGLRYDVAGRIRNIDVTPFPGVRRVDGDALQVVAQRVSVHDAAAGPFAANLGPVAPGVVLARGWVAVVVTVGTRSYTVASTHLESGEAPGLAQLRATQAGELAQALSGPEQAILLGDLNDVPGSPMYKVLLAAGLTDVWTALRGGARGYTCCHTTDLSNQVRQFHKLVDYVFARLAGGSPVKGQIQLLGDVPSDRFPGPAHRLWPSDHAGLVARLTTRPPQP